MKKVLALLAVAACALPVLVGAQGDNAKMLQIFSAQQRTDWGNLQVIVLNDRTVEALFSQSPAKAAFRTKARMTSVFFVQGTVNKEFQLKPDVNVIQKGETIAGKEAGWTALRAGAHEALADVDFDALIARAQEQRMQIKPFRLMAAAAAFREPQRAS